MFSDMLFGTPIDKWAEVDRLINEKFSGNVDVLIAYLEDRDTTLEALVGHNILLTAKINKAKKVINKPDETDDIRIAMSMP